MPCTPMAGSEYRFGSTSLLVMWSGEQEMVGIRGRSLSRTVWLFASSTMKVAQKLAQEAFEPAFDPNFLRRCLPAFLLWLALSAGASAKDTGYVFVSHEK